MRTFVTVLPGILACLGMVGGQAQQLPENAARVSLAERLEAAESAQDRAALLDAASPELLALCLDRGQSFAAQSKLDPALRSYRAALDIARKLEDPAQESRAYSGIGVTHYRQGRIADALDDYRNGLAAAKSAGDEKQRAEMLRKMGVAWRGLGNFPEALAVDEESVAVFRRLGDTNGVIQVLNGIGISYVRLGNLRKAAEIFEQGVKLAESIGNQAARVNGLESLGNVYLGQGDIALSLRYLEQALAFREASGAPKREIANVYINLTVAYRRVDRSADAIRAAGRALDLGREIGDGQTSGYALLNRANVLQKLHRNPEALADLRASLDIFEKENMSLETAAALSSIAEAEFDLGHDDAALEASRRAAGLARAIPAPDILWQSLESAGAAYRRMGNPQLARAAYAEGAATVTALRKQLAGGEEQGLEFLRDKMNLFHGLMAVLVESGEVEEAWRVAERAKTGLIPDVLRAGHAGITKAMTPAEKHREQQLESAKDKRALEAFRSELYAAHPELELRRGESEPVTLAATAALLPHAQMALLEFAVAPEATYLFVIERDPRGQPVMHVHKLPWKAEALTREVEAFREQLATRSLAYRDAAAALYRKLLAPASAELRGKTLLAIVPDGPLWSLPFQALVGPNGRHLIEDTALFYAPSLTMLRETRRTHRPGTAGKPALLAMGDPELGAQPPGLARLPNAAREVAALGRWYGSASLTLTGAQASEAQWKALAPRYRILHLATHGVLNSSNPLYSYFVLSPGKGDDGLVEAREILDMDLHADLVVLSACETGRGGFRYGEGLVGLSWALMVAGSPASLVSQWKVDSDSTTELMLSFHRELARGKAAAFRAAALRLLESSQFHHPYYWAPFVLIGDGY